jgi:hypothetical protein
MIFTAGFKIILPRYAKISIRIMGAVCCHKNKTIQRGISHQRF